MNPIEKMAEALGKAREIISAEVQYCTAGDFDNENRKEEDRCKGCIYASSCDTFVWMKKYSEALTAYTEWQKTHVGVDRERLIFPEYCDECPIRGRCSVQDDDGCPSDDVKCREKFIAYLKGEDVE